MTIPAIETEIKSMIHSLKGKHSSYDRITSKILSLCISN
jgi:hypothetical protein